MRRSHGVIKTKGSNGAINPIKINPTIGQKMTLSIDLVPETEIMLLCKEDGVEIQILNGIKMTSRKEKSKVISNKNEMIGPKTIGKTMLIIAARSEISLTGRGAKAAIGNTITISMSKNLKLKVTLIKGIEIIVPRALSNSISTRKISLINKGTINNM